MCGYCAAERDPHIFWNYLFFQRSDSLNIMKKFSINQDEDVWSQLLYGIRYLDLRVGYYKTTPEKFWVVHDFVKMNPLYEVVNDIRRFLTSTKELVILDFHRYENSWKLFFCFLTTWLIACFSQDSKIRVVCSMICNQRQSLHMDLYHYQYHMVEQDKLHSIRQLILNGIKPLLSLDTFKH